MGWLNKDAGRRQEIDVGWRCTPVVQLEGHLPAKEKAVGSSPTGGIGEPSRLATAPAPKAGEPSQGLWSSTLQLSAYVPM